MICLKNANALLIFYFKKKKKKFVFIMSPSIRQEVVSVQ